MEHVPLKKLRRRVWWQRLPWWKVNMGPGVRRMRAIDLDDYGALDVAIGACFAEAALSLLRKTGTHARDVAAIGSHGQTIRHRPTGAHPFTLQIGERFTFAGQPDTMGAGMAIVLDAVLGKGFTPDGFDQEDGYRIYHYKKVD